MKGLLVKDFRLLTANREFIILTLLLGVGMLIFASGRQLFPLMFVMFVAAIVGAGTINDDEADNGNAFLFTMPFSVREYVAEKYLFCFMLSFGAMVVMAVGAAAAVLLGKGDRVSGFGATYVLSLVAAVLMQAWTIPVNLRFGGRKSNIANAVIFFVVFAAIALILNMFTPGIGPVYETVSAMGLKVIAAAGFVAAALIYAASIAVSLRIMAKKEF